MFLLNGEPGRCVDVSDRGFQYGDGLFETIEVLGGKPLFLQRHLNRLAKGCQRLLIPQPCFELLVAESLQMAASAERAVLKWIVTRGSGGRGYRQPAVIKPTRLLSLHPYPEYPPQLQTDGIVARICQQALGQNPTLAGIKHLNRLEQILARAEWQDDAIHEGLMLDRQGRVIEGTMSNLFVVKAGKLLTADLSESGVAGIVREILIEFAHSIGLPLQETCIELSDVWQAEELFISNAVIGIWPIKQLEHQSFNVGPNTLRLQQMLNAARTAELCK